MSTTVQAAIAHHVAGRLAEAEGLYRQILAVDPKDTDALHMLGVLAHQLGRFDVAVEFIGRALATAPDFAEARYNLGAALEALRRVEAAIECYERVIATSPEMVAAHYRLGVIFLGRGDLGRAIAGLDKAIALQPDHAEAHLTLGNAFRAGGRLEDSVNQYRRALDVRPDYREAFANLGCVLHDLGRSAEAVSMCERALSLQPDAPDILYNLGNALRGDGRLDEAVEVYRKSLAIDPDQVVARNNLGNVLVKLERLDEAIECFQCSLAIKGDQAVARSGLGAAFHQQGRYSEALEHLRMAVAIRPGSDDAHNTLGLTEKNIGHYDQAIAAYDRALAVRADFHDARANRALALFATGRLREAWRDYESRWSADKPPQKRPFPQPSWDGQPLDDRTLLVWGEQGLADEIMGLTMVPDAVARVGHCVVECDRRLVDLAARTFPGVTVVPREDPPHPRAVDADRQIPALGLGQYFRNEFGDFPRNPTPLVPDSVKAAHWKRWLDGLRPGLKVGLSWRGRLMTAQRSRFFAPIGRLGPILRIPGVVFVNLQYDDSAEDIESIRALTGVAVHSAEDLDLTNDLDGMAALMAGLDAVVGPATAVGDLAGALGRPTWMYAYYPVSAEKTICGTDHVPWYPAVRLETCGHGEDWDGVVGRVADSLKDFVDRTAIGGG